MYVFDCTVVTIQLIRRLYRTVYPSESHKSNLFFSGRAFQRPRAQLRLALNKSSGVGCGEGVRSMPGVISICRRAVLSLGRTAAS